MDNLKFNVYFILEQRYKKLYNLPKDWNEIEDIDIKTELLGKAINISKKIEDLKEYKELNNDNR